MTDLFVLCYSVAEARSFVALEEWVAEMRHHEPRVPFVLLALQTDLRDADGGKACITTAQGQAKAQALGAKAFHEVSNKTQAGIEEAKQAVFDAAVDAKKNPVEEEDDAAAAGAVAAADEAAAAAEEADDEAEAAEMKRMAEGSMELAKQMLGMAVSVVQSAAAAAAAPAPVTAAASSDESASSSSKASSSYADPSSVKYSLDQLKAGAETRPADVDPARREAYSI